MTTGRLGAVNTADALSKNLLYFGHPPGASTLLVNYDPSYRGLSNKDFLIPSHLCTGFEQIVYLGPTEVDCFRQQLIRMGLSSHEAMLVTQPEGFGCRKNLAYLIAMREGFEAVLFWDDDEYPSVWAGNSAPSIWYSTDILGEHKSALSSTADVSFGFWSGYSSPVPSDLPAMLAASTLASLEHALSLATETFKKDTLSKADYFLTCSSEPPALCEIRTENGGKWISGGNLAVSMDAVRDGRVPAFYNPPGSRGDDTILSLRLGDARVFQVAAGIFHDCFELYPEVALGARPTVTKRPSLRDPLVERRFAAALDAWLAYSPMYLYLSDAQRYHEHCQVISEELERVDRNLQEDLPSLAANIPGGTIDGQFDLYRNALENRLSDLHTLDRVWPQVYNTAFDGPPLYESSIA